MTSVIENPLYVFAILNLSIFMIEWLSKKPVFNYLGTALMVILAGALLANLGAIPSASNSTPLYSAIFKYLAPLSIFYLLLEVNLKSLRKAGLPMLIMFFIGALGTASGAFIGMYLLNASIVFGENYKAIAGMFTGTYIGGSVNFNALAIHYKMMEQGTIYAGSVAVDNIITTLWMVVCIAVPKLFGHLFHQKKGKEVELNVDSAINTNQQDEVSISPQSVGLLLFFGLGSMLIANLLSEALKNKGYELPPILIVTTIALVLAQIKFISQLKGSRLFGLYSIYLFLIVIGAYCEIAAILSIGTLALNLLLFAIILVLTHAILVFGIGRLLKIDSEMISIASQANIGGSSTALALARSFKREDLLLPGILIGSLGNGVGTYIAFLVASLV